jgi:hypothetical protein
MIALVDHRRFPRLRFHIESAHTTHRQHLDHAA